MALVTMLSTARCIASGSNMSVGIVGAGSQSSSTFASLARVFMSSTTSPTTSLRSDGSGTGSRSLLNVSMSITSVGNAFLILFDDAPAFAHDADGFFGRIDIDLAAGNCLGVVFHAHFDQVAAAADALQNVLDVVRERGDRLADGGQTFGLHHLLVVIRIFDRERRLMGDRDHELQMFLRELVGGTLLQNALGRERGVDVDHADHIVAALHRHADRLADAHAAKCFWPASQRSSSRALLVSTPSLRSTT